VAESSSSPFVQTRAAGHARVDLWELREELRHDQCDGKQSLVEPEEETAGAGARCAQRDHVVFENDPDAYGGV
jgi:hypothetical protein